MTPAETKLFDSTAKDIAVECFRRSGKVEGCAQLGSQVANALISERRAAQKADNRNHQNRK